MKLVQSPQMKKEEEISFRNTAFYRFIYYCIIFAFATLIRLILLLTQEEWFRDRVELSSPTHSLRRIEECVYLTENAQNGAYDSSMCHETPIVLWLMKPLLKDYRLRWAIFIGVDLVIGILLQRTASSVAANISVEDKIALDRQRRERGVISIKDSERKSNYKSEYGFEEDADAFFRFAIKNSLLSPKAANWLGILCMLCYLFNPYAIGTCVAQNTASFDNLLLALILYFVYAREWRYPAILINGIATYRTIYFAVLAVPTALWFRQRSEYHVKPEKKSSWLPKVIDSVIAVIQVSCIAMLLVAVSVYLQNNNTNFIRETYLFSLKAEDLTPTVGLFWYFFIEMFEHFHLLFLCTFQLNLFFYVIPLALTLSDHSFVLQFALMALICIFKPYTTLADAAFYMSFLPIFANIQQFLRHSLLVAGTLIAVTLLAPVMWSLWIVQGSANANFYFALTLAYNAAQVFLITDVLFAWMKKQALLKDGFYKDVTVTL